MASDRLVRSLEGRSLTQAVKLEHIDNKKIVVVETVGTGHGETTHSLRPVVQSLAPSLYKMCFRFILLS